MSRYAISDIHGCCQTFRLMVEEILQLQLSDQLFLLGDYIDRGPDSKGVIDFIMDLRDKGYQVEALRGNHEAMMLASCTNPSLLSLWLRNGGDTTLASFGIKELDQLPDQYWDFIEQLPYYRELDDWLLVHAGFDFRTGDPFSNLEAMLWTRQFEVDQAFLGRRKIAHGHTPTPSTRILLDLLNPDTRVVNIDGGCVYSNVPELGRLTALNLDTLELHVLPNLDAVAPA